MFLRRGHLNAKTARALLIELFDQRYQWPLRTPIAHLLARGDPLRFLCSLDSLVRWVGQGIFLLNQKQPPQQMPWFGSDLADLPHHPANLTERLAFIRRLDEPLTAEVEVRRLLFEIIELVPPQKKRGREEIEQPLLSWLPRIADLDAPAKPVHTPKVDPATSKRFAQQAVRIVWRLPGSRLAAVTGSVAAGYADLTSDIDISLFGLKLPKADIRRSLIAATAGDPDDITQVSEKTFAGDAFWLTDRSSDGHQVLIDVRYYLIEEVQRLIAHPEPESRADAELLAHLSTADILVDYELRGPDLLHDLQQATARARSDRIARASTDLNLELTRLEASRESADTFRATVEAIRAVFQLLSAHNDRWIVFPKWTADWLDGLERVPSAAHQRLSSVAVLPFRPENHAARLKAFRTLQRDISAL